jgi:hypothetical protein
MTIPARLQVSGLLLALFSLSAPPFAEAGRLGEDAPASAASEDRWSEVTARYLQRQEEAALAACEELGLSLPADFLGWIEGDPQVRASVYGCGREPLQTLLGLYALELDLGQQAIRRDHTQLALAFAIQDSYAERGEQGTRWNDADGARPPRQLPDISPRPRLELSVPGDPRAHVDTKDATRELDRDDHIINFLEDHPPVEVEESVEELPPLEYDESGIAKPRGAAVSVKRLRERPLLGADVIASAALQAEFNGYMREHGFPEVQLDCGEQVVHWQSKAAVADRELRGRIAAAHELFHAAYRNKGRMPAERDRAPTPAESMAWFLRNDRHEFSAADRVARAWPRFPLDAPWPVLMMLAADDQPLREREEIWLRFRDHGELRTYGEYIGGIAQQFDMQSARRVSPFAFSYGSIQMMWKDGGVCGTMGNIGARTYRIVGVPASTATQPGHCAIVRMDHDPATGGFRCIGGQYATGGDEVTTVHAGWNYDGRGGRKPMIYHQAVAWGVSFGSSSFLDMLVLGRAWQALDEASRASDCASLVEDGLGRNPFALHLLEAAVAAAPDLEHLQSVLEAFERATASLHGDPTYALYLTTARALVDARRSKL